MGSWDLDIQRSSSWIAMWSAYKTHPASPQRRGVVIAMEFTRNSIANSFFKLLVTAFRIRVMSWGFNALFLSIFLRPHQGRSHDCVYRCKHLKLHSICVEPTRLTGYF